MRSTVLKALVTSLALLGSPVPSANADSTPASLRARTDASRESPGRVLHFPRTRVVGTVWVRDSRLPRELDGLYYWSDDSTWEFLAPAMGDVTIPEGRWATLRVNSAGWHDLSFLKAMRPDDLYRLTFQSSYKAPPSNACMPHIARLTGLKVLELRYTTVTDRGLSHLRSLPSLERLALPRGITDAGLAEAARLRSLKGLYFMPNQITDAGLAHLARLTRLQELELGGRNLTDAGLAHLAALPSLSSLVLSCEHYVLGGLGENFTNGCLIHLAKFPALKTLSLSKLRITDAGMAHLASMARLENLDLRDTLVTDAGLTHLKRMPSLKKLVLDKRSVSLDKYPIGDRGAAFLKECKPLEYLSLPEGFTAQGLAQLVELPNLTHLNASSVHSSPLGDDALQVIARLSRLKSLTVGGTGITDAGIAHIASLSKLEELYLFRVGLLTDTGLAKLASLNGLNKLMLPSSSVTSSGLRRLNSLVNLETLHLGTFVQDDSPLDLSGLAKLEEVYFRTELRDQDVAWLASLKHLKVAFLPHGVSDAGLAFLKGKPSIRSIAASGSGITNASLESMGSIKSLQSLQISGTFTDDGLQYLEGLPALEVLRINSVSALGQEALGRLRNRLPCLMSYSDGRYKPTTTPTDAPPKRPRVGDKAPTFTAKTLDGSTLDLAQMNGKTVLLYFWATWCSPCVASMPGLKQFHAKLSAEYRSFQMIGLSLDEDESRLRRFVQDHALAWPQARLGLNSEITAKYVDDTAPHYVLIGPDGRIISTSRDTAKIEAAVARAAGDGPE